MAAARVATARRPTSKKKAKTKRSAGPSARKLSRLRKPDDLSLEDWQTQLRRQWGAQQNFGLKNLGDEKVFSDFQVTNPDSGGTYRVAIRGEEPGVNFCSCPDFATNALGTCKHVEFVLHRLRRRRGGKKTLAEGYQPAFSEIYLQYGAQREVRFRRGADCPVELARLASRYFDDEGCLLNSAAADFDKLLEKAGKLDADLRVYNDALGWIAQRRDAARRQEILKKAFPRGIRSAAMNKLLGLSLYDYQRQGALFAAAAGRSLIGDEMGLGKTIQAIAAAEIMARHFGVERVLIVCPTSLKHQWQREIERTTERTATVIGGLRPKRAERFAEPSFYKITNYDTIHRDLELIDAWSPDLVILDEAQRIKNWETRAARSVKQIASPYCIVLTGTPLENRLEELVSIVQFIDQHRLGPTFRFLHDHQIYEEGSTRVVGYKNLDRVAQTLEPILLRRRKKEVLGQLPERVDNNLFLPMTDQQWEHHDENREIVARLVQKWRRHHYLSEGDQLRLRIALQNMRMSCDSTYLLDKVTDHGTKADELATLLDEIFEDDQAKVVIFSQWLRMHELVQRRLQARNGRGDGHVLFHGGVPGEKRKALVDQFREDPKCRVFLATDAGGVGLNLQHSAAVVVNLDLPWNPAVLEQRIGRVHRLGQNRSVQVFNFISEETIEHGMLGLLGFKKSLFSGILDGGEKEVFLGGSRLKKFMETVETATESTSGKHESAAVESGEDEPATQSANGAARAAGNGAETSTPSSSSESETRPSERPADLPPGATPTVAADNPWAALLTSGVALLEQFAAAAQSTEGKGTSTSGPSGRTAGLQVVRSDEEGAYLKLPMPRPEAVQQVLAAVRQLLGGAG